MTNHGVCNKSNTTGAISAAGTAYPSGAPELTVMSLFSLNIVLSMTCIQLAIFSCMSFTNCKFCRSYS